MSRPNLRTVVICYPQKMPHFLQVEPVLLFLLFLLSIVASLSLLIVNTFYFTVPRN